MGPKVSHKNKEEFPPNKSVIEIEVYVQRLEFSDILTKQGGDIMDPRIQQQKLKCGGGEGYCPLEITIRGNYRVFHRFRQARFDNGDSILSSSQFLLLPQLPQK